MSYEEFVQVQDEFRQAIEDISYLQPELSFEVADRISNDTKFYYATGRTGEAFLAEVLKRRGEKGISTNIYVYGGGKLGSTQVGKSIASIILAKFEDEDFASYQPASLK